MKNKVMDKIFLGVLTLFFGIILFQSMNLNRTAGLMPKYVCSFALVLCAVTLFVDVIKERTKTSADSAKEKEESADWQDYAKDDDNKGIAVWVTLLCMVGYLIMLWLFGFIIASLVITILLPVLMQYKKWVVVIPVALCATISIYFSFIYIFHISLPGGIIMQLFK